MPTTRITLYRAQFSARQDVSIGWWKYHPQVRNAAAAAGRWFTDSLEEARWYLANEYFDGGALYALTLPASEAEPFRVSNLPVLPGGKDTAENPRAFSRRPEAEFFLPPHLARTARPWAQPPPLSSTTTMPSPTASAPTLADAELAKARLAAADSKFAAHDFGDSTVTDTDGWTQDGVYWSRWAYGDDEHGERFRVSFGVEFREGTDAIVDSWVET